MCGLEFSRAGCIGVEWHGVGWGGVGESRLECDLVRGCAPPDSTHLATPPLAQIAGLLPPRAKCV
jgi:hypothetical protein